MLWCHGANDPVSDDMLVWYFNELYCKDEFNSDYFKGANSGFMP